MVYVINGSEDGVFCVAGSYKKAYEKCVGYIKQGQKDFTPPTFDEFKKELRTTDFIMLYGSDQATCSAYRMEIE